MGAAWLVALLVLARGAGPERTTTTVALGGEPPGVTLVHEARVDGRVRIWVEAEGLDTTLAVECAGRATAEDDDSGGRPAPSLDVPVQPGQRLEIVVRSKGAGGEARVVVVELPESESARARAGALRDRLDAASDAGGDPRERRDALRAIETELTADPELATSDNLQLALEALVLALADAGEHASALHAAERLRAVSQDVLAPDSARRARAVGLVANALGQLGRHAEAVRAHEEGIAILRRTRPPEDPVRLAAEANGATALFGAGAHAEALAIWEGVVRAAPAVSDTDRRDVATIRANMAVAAFYLGDLPRARAEVEAARSAADVVATGSPLDLRIRAVHGAIVAEQGDHRAGRLLARETLARARESLPPGHVDLAVAELNFALSQVRSGEDLAARETLARILADPPEGLAESHPLLVQSRLNLAAVDLRLDRPAAALEAIEEQLATLGPALPRTNAVVRALSRNRALALAALGRFEEAERAETELLDVARALLPADHPERLRLELQPVWTLARLGRFEEARSAAESGGAAFRDALAARATILSPREAESSLQGLWNSLDLALACLLDRTAGERAPGSVVLAFELSETARGLALAAQRSARAAAAGGTTVIALRDAARRAQIELVRAARSAGDEELHARIEARDDADRALREALARLGHRVRPVSAAAVCAALRPEEAAVAWRVRAWNPDGDARVGSLQEILSAFVARADGSLVCIDLGPVASVADACRAWRAELERVPHDRAAARAAGERVRSLVVDPLSSRTQGATRWIVAPDGPLLTIPLDALPGTDASLEARLGDAIRIVTTWSFAPAPAARIAAGSERVVLVGDAAFGAPKDGAAPRWTELPATAAEIDEIASLWRATRPAEPAPSVLRRSEATPASLASVAPSARWLHVATHGSFAPDEGAHGFLTVSGEDPAFDAGARVRALLPLVRCDLALAGANSADAGLLSAEELAGLDLGACRLAVLSACDTGRGEIVAGQGVASFQRAVAAAGAEACATSLWRVPDEAARELMAVFYRRLWVDGLEPAEALWSAKQALRNRRAPPRDWAAWVLASSFGSGAGETARR